MQQSLPVAPEQPGNRRSAPCAERTPQPPQAHRQKPDKWRAAAQVGPVLSVEPRKTPGDQADGEVAAAAAVAVAVARMHTTWERTHQARAKLIQAQTAGSSGAAAARQAEAAAERAMAAEAAEHRVDSGGEDEAAQSAPDAVGEQTRQCAEQAELHRPETRIRARLEWHRDRKRGPGRMRPGPAGLLDHEIQVIERALAERRPTRAPQIARLVGARYWGPGVFGRASPEAVGDGRVRRVGRNIYAAGDSQGDQRPEPG